MTVTPPAPEPSGQATALPVPAPPPPVPAAPPVPAQSAGPDAAAPPAAGTTAYRCPSCGATITYAPGTTELACPSCGGRVHIDAPAGHIDEHSYNAWLATSPPAVASVAMQNFTCQSCGAASESDEIAGPCPFCGGALVAAAMPQGLIRPEALVPFVVAKPAATEAFSTWIKSRWFAPTKLKKLHTLQGGLNGVYTPHFTYDAATVTDYTGERGIDHTETYTTSDGHGNTQVHTRTVTNWYPASGEVSRSFDDVLVPATTRVLPDRLAALEPWLLESAVPYQADYLAGYSALRYDVDPPAALDEAKAIMAKTIETDCRRDIGGDHQRVSRMDTRYSNLMFKLLLLPIWIAAYSYSGKTYQVIVNAQTGEVLGSRPYSWLKITLAVIGALIIIGLIIAAIAAGHHSGHPASSALEWALHAGGGQRG